MNVVKASAKMRGLIEKADKLPDTHPEYGKEHLRDMCDKIESGKVVGEQSHRWLGWLQACIVMGGGATLEEMKATNISS